jgi:dimethylargininase
MGDFRSFRVFGSMHFTHAITRKPGKNFARGLTSSKLGAADYGLISKQHAAYVETLRSTGLEVLVLNEQPDYPDAHFVEDTAVVTPHVAVMSRPGAEARQGEEDTIAPVLTQYRQTVHVQPPATLDGGDVLMVDNHFFIGISTRTNSEGAEQLGQILETYGNTWQTIPVEAGLHLKSSINYLGNNMLIVTKDFANKALLEKYDKIVVDETEAYAANTLWVNDRLLTPQGYPKTKQKLQSLGFDLIELDMSEVRKMDGGLTCWSIRF